MTDRKRCAENKCKLQRILLINEQIILTLEINPASSSSNPSSNIVILPMYMY
jgi:hypothetical protein